MQNTVPGEKSDTVPEQEQPVQKPTQNSLIPQRIAGTILQGRQRALLLRERALVADLQTNLARLAELDHAHIEVLKQVVKSLDELFLLVIVGEFNSGKSATINALLRSSILKEGVVPTTEVITIIRYAAEEQQKHYGNGLLEIGYPAEILRDIAIVDTPGVNAVLRKHQQITEEFIPRSDLILFIASADRPFTESERIFLAQMRTWGKKIIFIVNKMDLLRTPEDRQEVLTFVKKNCQELLGFEPQLFPVSAYQAEQSAHLEKAEAAKIRAASGFTDLENYLQETLDETERIRLKLLTPLGVMERLLGDTRGAVELRALLLTEDANTIKNIEEQQRFYQQDMERSFELHLKDIENIILEMRERGLRFFDKTIRIGRILDLLRAEKIRDEFQKEVIGDSEKRIDRAVQDMIDWMMEQEQRLWQDVMEYLDRRKEASVRDDKVMIGQVGRNFDYNRRALLHDVSRVASEVVKTYNHDEEAADLSQSLRNSVAQAALVSAGGIGLGTVIVAATTVAAFDITGILAGALLLGVGFYIIPARRNKAKKEFSAKMDELRQRLRTAMQEQFQKQLIGSTRRINEAIAPYTRFVRAEQERTNKALEQIATLEKEVVEIRREIEHV